MIKQPELRDFDLASSLEEMRILMSRNAMMELRPSGSPNIYESTFLELHNSLEAKVRDENAVEAVVAAKNQRSALKQFVDKQRENNLKLSACEKVLEESKFIDRIDINSLSDREQVYKRVLKTKSMS